MSKYKIHDSMRYCNKKEFATSRRLETIKKLKNAIKTLLIDLKRFLERDRLICDKILVT